MVLQKAAEMQRAARMTGLEPTSMVWRREMTVGGKMVGKKGMPTSEQMFIKNSNWRGRVGGKHMALWLCRVYSANTVTSGHHTSLLETRKQ